MSTYEERREREAAELRAHPQGWHVVRRQEGDLQPEFAVWYGPVLIATGIRDEAAADSLMRRRAIEEAATAEASWLKADAYWNFCRSELERLEKTAHG